MRKALLQLSIYLFFVFAALSTQAQNVAINTTGNSANASAILDVASDTKGVLIPRIDLQSYDDVSKIPSPAQSLLIYNIGTKIPAGYYYNAASSGATPSWVKLVTVTSTGVVKSVIPNESD